ncbi:hypothetical protein L598_000400001470 [Mesorhizobium sp. J18]|nr:hypothetical protein L598_000400001470 [Mesorhizobium sp. J18]
MTAVNLLFTMVPPNTKKQTASLQAYLESRT